MRESSPRKPALRDSPTVNIRRSMLRAECFAAICVARIALRLFPSRMLARACAAVSNNSAHIDAISIANEFHRVVASHPLSTNCLHRAIALQSVLRRRGASATLRIGVRRVEPMLPGHAWVEVDGVALEQANDYIALHVGAIA